VICGISVRTGLLSVDTADVIGPEFSDLLAAAQAGDTDAFAQLWRDANPALVRYLRGLLGATGEDLASETWLAVIRGLTKFSGGENQFRAWLFTIARHKLVDAQRRGKGVRLRPLEEVPASLEPPAADTADVAAERMSTERALALIATLPGDQAEVILLRVVAGLDTAAVARLVGKSEGAVRVSAHRALRRLAAALGERPVTTSAPTAFRDQDA
jgi:RNA polymerase sigma-70 factor (ECF subfamily)